MAIGMMEHPKGRGVTQSKSRNLAVTIRAACAPVAIGPSAQAQRPAGTYWALRWTDEFNDVSTANGMGLDPNKWSSAYPWTRVHNYPAYIRDENIHVNASNNGLLQLWGKRESYGRQPFTSGAVNTTGKLNFALPG